MPIAARVQPAGTPSRFLLRLACAGTAATRISNTASTRMDLGQRTRAGVSGLRPLRIALTAGGEQALQDFRDEGGVRAAAGLLHDLADEVGEDGRLPGAVLGDLG